MACDILPVASFCLLDRQLSVVVVVVVFPEVVAMMPMVTRGHDEAVTVWPLAADLLPASAAPLPQARPHPTTLT